MDHSIIFNVLKQSIQSYTTDKTICKTLWKGIVEHYTSGNRAYHNLKHIEIMLNLAKTYQSSILNVNGLSLAIIYHDIIYDVKRQDNELKSWEYAKQHLNEILPDKDLICIKDCILATKGHEYNNNNDVNFMLDFDLFTLGQSWEQYLAYTKQIRKEYDIYPDHLYKTGRIQVLEHFLNSERIYKTHTFYEQYERQAKANLMQELDFLKTNTYPLS